MKNPPYRTNDPVRRVQSGSDRPLGFLPTIKAQIADVAARVKGLELSLTKRLDNGEPGAIVAERVFRPEAGTFAFDYLQDGSSSVVSQYVLRDGVTYEIPIMFPPPGVMLVRRMKVRVLQRLYVPGCGAMQIPMQVGDFALRAAEVLQTKKYSFPDNADAETNTLSRRMSFLWNIADTKSGMQFADDLVPDLLLLPQAVGATGTLFRNTGLDYEGLPMSSSPDCLTFKQPWLFEHDGQARFMFRPLMPVIQPAASDAYAPYAFDDKENGIRDSSVTVRVELHGDRYMTTRDAMREGALVDGGAR